MWQLSEGYVCYCQWPSVAQCSQSTNITNAKMSLIGLVPRLTSWGSGLRLDKEVLKKISGSQENAPKENEWPNERRKQKKKQRARISYWSDSEEIIIRRSAR